MALGYPEQQTSVERCVWNFRNLITSVSDCIWAEDRENFWKPLFVCSVRSCYSLLHDTNEVCEHMRPTYPVTALPTAYEFAMLRSMWVCIQEKLVPLLGWRLRCNSFMVLLHSLADSEDWRPFAQLDLPLGDNLDSLPPWFASVYSENDPFQFTIKAWCSGMISLGNVITIMQLLNACIHLLLWFILLGSAQLYFQPEFGNFFLFLQSVCGLHVSELVFLSGWKHQVIDS